MNEYEQDANCDNTLMKKIKGTVKDIKNIAVGEAFRACPRLSEDA